ncbi:MAG: replication initiation protein [Bacteroidetes bacterium]|nr:replication initiation protein [Bacteroidota bacterium]
MRKSKKWMYRLLVVMLLIASCRAVNPVMIYFENDTPSTSYGESWKGHLENGKRMPSYGYNFSGVSYLLLALGRNGVHSAVRDLTVAAYDTLYSLHPEWRYLYGETGWVKGGKFWPHYTHQNGMVIDFMVPVIKKNDSSVVMLPHSIFKRFGYAFEFDSLGETSAYRIDFESMAAHLHFLNTLAPGYHLKIRRIIFAPEFLPYLYQTSYGEEMKKLLFVYNKRWLRHDDHYHTEFQMIE